MFMSLVALPLLSLALLVPAEAFTNRTACRNPLVRQEWRTLSDAEKLSYIAAVKCIMAKPARSPESILPGAGSFYEDFVGTHILQTEVIHYVGIFMPWHRYFMHLYETELHACGFSGGHPYWDWTLDSSLSSSPIFTELGMGGNGLKTPLNESARPPNLGPPQGGVVPGAASLSSLKTGSTATATATTTAGTALPTAPPAVVFTESDHTGGGCISTGPFANLTTNLGPNANVKSNPRCVTRSFWENIFTLRANKEMVALVMRQADFGSMTKMSEASVHGGGHVGIGGTVGDMTDRYSSPVDPVFFLHHSNMDRLWWSWQMQDLKARLGDMSGPLVLNDWTNAKGGNATLETIMNYEAMTASIPVRQVMDIQSGGLCYTYDTLYM